MNLGALKTALKRYGFDDNDPLVTWINAGRNETVADLPLSVSDDEAAFNSSAGVSDLSSLLPADFFKVVELIDVTDPTNVNPLDYMDYRKFRREIAGPDLSGSPSTYYVRNLNQIKIWPVPTQTTSWLLIYSQSVTQLVNDADTPTELPAQFHYIYVYRAAAIALAAENEEDRSAAAMTEYATAKESLIMAYNQRQAGSFGTVNDSMGYAGG